MAREMLWRAALLSRNRGQLKRGTNFLKESQDTNRARARHVEEAGQRSPPIDTDLITRLSQLISSGWLGPDHGLTSLLLATSAREKDQPHLANARPAPGSSVRLTRRLSVPHRAASAPAAGGARLSLDSGPMTNSADFFESRLVEVGVRE